MKLFLHLFLLSMIIFSSSRTSSAEINAKYGLDLRLRQEIWEHVFDMGVLHLENENFLRLKISPWAQWDFTKDTDIYVKLTNEARYYISSSNADNKHFDEDSLSFENLFVDFRNAGGLPIDLRLGRQDLKYGDGFLIWDGTPVSGDRTKYFNAAKATVKFNQNNSADLVYMYQPITDTLLPSLHGHNTGKLYQDDLHLLENSDERAAVLYARSTINEHLLIEPYYIYKQEGKRQQSTVTIPELDLNTIGARAVYQPAPWTLKGEFARQFGRYNGGRERRGIGGEFFIDRVLEGTPGRPDLQLGYIYLSGDDPNTSADEAWDPLYSRWKWISTAYKYAYFRETGQGPYWTNLSLYRFNVKVNVSAITTLSLAYNILRANEETRIVPPNPNAAIFSNHGKGRGQLEQAVLVHKFTPNIDGLVSFDYFEPGNFYSDSARDAFVFSWELQLRL